MSGYSDSIKIRDVDEDFRRRGFKCLDKQENVGAHKYNHGHALVLGGSAGFTGAGRLVARGALRVGAGLVTLGCPHTAIAENAAQLTSVMLMAVEDGMALATKLENTRIAALCLGPGFGVERAGEMLSVVLEAPRPTVLDADALSALALDATLFDMLHSDCILAPHGGEFARLFPDIAAKSSAASKVEDTLEASSRAGCIVLYKGVDTVIADPSGNVAVHFAKGARAAPWLATAGSGDVLAGFITGLLARGFDAMQAAETGAWLHVECALKFGAGLIAEDLPEQLPKVFADLGL